MTDLTNNDDIYSGNDSANVINALAGDDIIYGFGGNDTINGGDDNDELVGDYGNDLLYGGNGNDTLDGSANNDTLYGGTGQDLLKQGGIQYGEAGNDTLEGGGNADYLDGGSENDQITGGNGNDTIIGGSGTDSLVGGLNNDRINGDAGIDTIHGGSGTDSIDGGDDNDIIEGGDDSDTILGGTGADNLKGDNGSDVLYAGAGDDTSRGGAGNDTIYGGNNDIFASGTDTAIGETGNDAYYHNGNGHLTIIENSEPENNDSIHLTQSSHGDLVIVAAGSHLIIRTEIDDDNGVTANDVVISYFFSGTQNKIEWMYDKFGVARNIGQEFGTNLADTMYGSTAGDSRLGFGGNDSIIGSGGNDTLSGGAGADTLDGGADNDMVSYLDDTTGVEVDLSLSTAQSGGEAAGDILLNIENVFGGQGNDDITGNTADNMLFGHFGDDTLTGGAGADILAGELGADVLKGEAGMDTYVIYNVMHSTASSMDVILGFSQADDVIDLSELGFSDIHEGQINAEGTALAYWFQYGDTYVGNADGSFRVRIDGEFNLTRSDFVGVGPDYSFTHIGTTGNDSLVGTAGYDRFDGGKGQDVLRGNAGNDIYFYDHLEDSKDSAPDNISYWSSGDVIDVSYLGFTGIQAGSANGSTLGWAVSGSYTEIFDSGKFLIRIQNSNAIDTPNLTASNFIFSDGPAFSDQNYSGTSSADTYTSGQGNDVLNGNDGDDSLTGGAGHDTIDGGAGNDTLVGGDGDDTLFGQSGYDRLEAGAGHDVLIAGTNKDWLVGGSGNDTFMFFSPSHTSDIQPDTIADFVQGDDIIDVSAITSPIDYTGIQSGSASGTILGFTHGQNSASQDITVIEDGVSFELVLMGHINLVTGDFAF